MINITYQILLFPFNCSLLRILCKIVLVGMLQVVWFRCQAFWVISLFNKAVSKMPLMVLSK